MRRLEAASALQPPGSRDFKSPPEISCGSVPCSDQATHPLYQSPFLWYPVHLMINLLDIFWPAIERVWFLNKYFLFRHHDPHHLCEAGAGRPGPCHHQGLQCPAQDHIQDGFWGQWTASHPRRCEVPKICWDCKSQAAWWHSQVDHMCDAMKINLNYSDLQSSQPLSPGLARFLKSQATRRWCRWDERAKLLRHLCIFLKHMSLCVYV